MRAVAAVIAAPVIRSVVTVVTAQAAVTLDPRGLNPIVFNVIGVGDSAVLVLTKALTEQLSTVDLYGFEFVRAAQVDVVSAADAATALTELPKTDDVAASDQLQPWSLTKAVDDGVYLDDFATRSINGAFADQATTDDFSEPVDDLGWDMGRTHSETFYFLDADYVASDYVNPSLFVSDQPALAVTLGTIADALSAPTDASQILVGKNPTETATASDAVTGFVIAYNDLADGGNYFDVAYNTQRYAVGDLMTDLAAKSVSKSGIADSISLVNTGGLVMTDYVDTRWFLDNYTGTYRALS